MARQGSSARAVVVPACRAKVVEARLGSVERGAQVRSVGARLLGVGRVRGGRRLESSGYVGERCITETSTVGVTVWAVF